MLSGDPPPVPGNTRGDGEQLPGAAAQPHPDNADDVLAAADHISGATETKSNPTAGESWLSNLPASVVRRLARVEGHLGSPMESVRAAGEDPNNRTQYDRGVKQNHETHAHARGCGASGSMVGVDGNSRRQITASEIAARSARQPKLFLSVGHDEYWSGNQRGE